LRVTFVIPPSGFLLDDRVFPTLGALKVAAVLEAEGVDVDVLDLCGVLDVAEAMTAHLESHQSDVYGFTATMPQMPVAAALAAQVRTCRPEARLVLGGPHVTLMQASARQERKRGESGRACQAMAELSQRFDVLVCGDGELAIGSALMNQPPPLIDADDPASAMFLKPADLNDGPFASRHLIDVDSYHYTIDGMRAQSLIGQLGCPFGCAFCGGRSSPFLRRVRTRSTERVIAEMRHLYDTFGTSGFMFFDDELNVNKLFMDLLTQMIELQHQLGSEFRMRGFLKAELITPAMAQAMFTAGFRQVLVGFESGDPGILKNIRKVATREDNTAAVHMLQDAGIKVKAAMSVGHPGESAETIESTRQWLLDVKPDEFDVTIITVYPGTPYYDDARETKPGVWTYTDPKSGDRLHGYHIDHLSDVNFYKGVPGSYRSFVYTDHVSAEELCVLRDDVESDVRSQLAIPYPQASPALNYEHSMGQAGPC
jgi:anaerobic magnesium-protoporphyrin IX monomethyl ester cyclase